MLHRLPASPLKGLTITQEAINLRTRLTSRFSTPRSDNVIEMMIPILGTAKLRRRNGVTIAKVALCFAIFLNGKTARNKGPMTNHLLGSCWILAVYPSQSLLLDMSFPFDRN